jgi:hypothetical protein
MIRAAVSGVMLLLLLWPCALAAQEEAAATAEAAESVLPDFGARTVPGESVVDLADFVSSNMEATGSVPDLAQVRTADGELRTMTTAEVFVLLARAAYLWRTTGNLPETVPITPDEVSPPVLDAVDVVLPPEDLDVGREIPTEQFLGQCPAVVRWADRLQVIPTAVWVDGKRLSAAEYLAGLAVCVSYAYWEGELSDTIFLPAYAPPTSWAKEAEPSYAEAEYAQAEEQPAAEEPLYATAEASEYGAEEAAELAGQYESAEVPLEELEGQEEEFPIEEDLAGEDWWGEEESWGEEYGAGLTQEEEFGEYEEEPPEEEVGEEEVWAEEYPEDFEEWEGPQGSEYEIAPGVTVIPEPGDTVSGIVDMVVSYSGPPAKFVIFTFDAKGEAMMNTPPYSSRWDTSKLEPGTHQVRIQILGEDEEVLIDQTSAYTVVAPARKESPSGAGTKAPEAGGS